MGLNLGNSRSSSNHSHRAGVETLRVSENMLEWRFFFNVSFRGYIAAAGEGKPLTENKHDNPHVFRAIMTQARAVKVG